MNVIWVISDTLRSDHLGCYGNKTVRTPSLDTLAAKSVRFSRHYGASFPTMPTRADFLTGRLSGFFMRWQPLPHGTVTLPTILQQNGFQTAAIVDTPFYMRQNDQPTPFYVRQKNKPTVSTNLGEAMNYDQGFYTFIEIANQMTTVIPPSYRNEERKKWRFESERFAPRTFTKAMEWLEDHYKENFFLLVDTWDPHEPWDAPNYYTEMYWPDYDGEVIEPVYCSLQDLPDYPKEKLKKAHATYCGEITMVDTWFGHFMRRVENMGLMDNTAIIFTTDHGHYFGEHGGLFGKITRDKPTTGDFLEENELIWKGCPLYEELVHNPLLIYLPKTKPGVCNSLTSAIDLMPTVLDILGQKIPAQVEGQSLLPLVKDTSRKGREFVISTPPFTDPPCENGRLPEWDLGMPGWDTTITTPEWSLLYSIKSPSELYNLTTDPKQEKNVIQKHPEVAKELHSLFVKFMKEKNVAKNFVNQRLTLKL